MDLLLKDCRHMAHRTVPNTLEIDAVAWRILEALQQNARKSFAEIGRQIGLSTPAVAERVHRLEEAGVITGYHVGLDLAKLGVPIRVLVRLTIPGGDLQVSRTVAAIKEMTEISRCHRVTGDESFVIEANVVSIRHMEALIDKLSALGATSTSSVLSSPVQRREYYARQIEAFDKYI
jgi:Lrp/AsnC family leucine-responsive transcriptional regulator